MLFVSFLSITNKRFLFLLIPSYSMYVRMYVCMHGLIDGCLDWWMDVWIQNNDRSKYPRQISVPMGFYQSNSLK